MTQRAIEVSFPIVEINRLAVPERNAFKPIYQMHKWFARRASCVFRAILLGCLKPAGTDIMAESYKDHTNDSETNGKLILDPFMGGGTTVVEALRLGCKVTGIDLNPVAWFIVKTEVEPVDVDALRAAFDRLAERRVAWSGKSVRETLLEQYKTECPCCGNTDADIIYTFWVKSAICTSMNCGKQVPLFSDYLVAQKSPSIRFWRDVRCPKCKKRFDWEVEPAALVGQAALMQTDGTTGAGVGRNKVRWAFSADKTVKCPWCDEMVSPEPPKSKTARPSKPERKKIPLSILLCPHCESVWQYRGELPQHVDCPVCHKEYDPHNANVPDSGKFVCPSCGNKEAIITSIRGLPDGQPLPIHPYTIHGYCAKCAGDGEDEEETDVPAATDMFDGTRQVKKKKTIFTPDHACSLTKSKGKFYRRISSTDLLRYQTVSDSWGHEKERLPYPKGEIPAGYNTNQILKHNYHYWHQMFTPRQLLGLSTILQAIDEEPDQTLKEMLLNGFSNSLDSNCTFAFYPVARQSMARMFTSHDFHPHLSFVENNLWGREDAGYTFPTFFQTVVEGKQFATEPYELKPHPTKDGSAVKVPAGEKLPAQDIRSVVNLNCQSSEQIPFLKDSSLNLVITDPPYAGNVNYSELADFFYVWLRLILAKTHPAFAPDATPKVAEIIENPTRGKSVDDFEKGLTTVFRECARVLQNDGILAFTFHHAEGSAWEAVIESLQNAGFYLLAAYPVHADAFHSESIGALGISYDLVHVCKKREADATIEQRSWAGIRQEIRRKAREEIRAIESGRYGQEALSPADINIILIGKCLELYSRHYGAVIDHEGNEVTLHNALIEIRSMVDQLVQKEQPLPAELEDIDAESRVYLLTLCNRKEVKSDDVHKATRGILEPEDLMETGLMIKGRAKGGRTYEVKQPAERFNDLLNVFGEATAPAQATLFGDAPEPKTKRRTLFIDKMHLLMGLADSGENITPWLARFRGDTPRLRAACEYLSKRNATFEPTLRKIMNLIDPLPLFKG